jgi:hypothetical protein
MTTVIIDTKTNEAKRLVEFLKSVKYVKIIEDKSDEPVTYNSDFVEMIKERENQPSVNLNIDEIWK